MADNLALNARQAQPNLCKPSLPQRCWPGQSKSHPNTNACCALFSQSQRRCCCSKVIIERARLRHLAWGDEQHIHGLLTANPASFDLVIGADVVYAEEFVPLLFHTAGRVASAEVCCQ